MQIPKIYKIRNLIKNKKKKKENFLFFYKNLKK